MTILRNLERPSGYGASVSVNNTWLNIGRARRVLYYLKLNYLSKIVDEQIIFQSFWEHPLFADDMWLNLIWGDDGSLVDIEIGVGLVLIDH